MQIENDAYFIGTIFCFKFIPIIAVSVWLSLIIYREKQALNITINETPDNHSVIKFDGNAVNYKLKLHKKKFEVMSTNSHLNNEDANRKVLFVRNLKLLVLFMIIFILTRLPQWLYEITVFKVDTDDQLLIIHYSLGLLTILNCMLNPILYVSLSKTT